MTLVLQKFIFYIKKEKCSEGIAAVKCLKDLIKDSSVTTIQEYYTLLNAATDEISSSDYPLAPIKSCSELFLRYITFSKLDTVNIDDCKQVLIDRAEKFVDKISKSSDVIAKACDTLLQRYSHILLSGGSSVVWKSFLNYIRSNSRHEICLYIIESEKSYDQVLKELTKLSKNLTIIKITHSSVAHIMDKVEAVFFGAEAVVGSGGIVNELGTLNVAIIAKAYNVPFYVCTECFKFIRFYPLSQRDIPTEFKYRTSVRKQHKDLSKILPSVDYTPPEYVTLLITDLGFILPTGVSEELIKLYL